MLFLPVIALAVIAGWLRRGRLAALAEVRLSRPELVMAALALQLALFSTFGEGLKSALPAWVAPAIHGASYALALAFIAANRHLRGWSLMALGAGANAVCVFANGGRMPVSAAALEAAGRQGRLSALLSGDGTFYNSVLAGEGARLAWLGDWLYLPAGIPLATVFSPGDVILALGVIVAVAGAMEGRRPVFTASGLGRRTEEPNVAILIRSKAR